ncbi:Rv1535 domain-containing protein [Mycobacterium saskatchewanense]|uniref:Rv1535 domain-containing protein n=1 Tax=Mycobacterium saskatchewanense TaxID=220927 RepID=UPI0021F372B6|nr:Rv1535 domain-containing protein [Mycobacterium saskatchewanense]
MAKTDSGIDSVTDPLASSIASVLRVPLVELYALLWRVGVVDVRRDGRARPAAVAACPNCSSVPTPGSQRRSRPSPQPRSPGPAPTRPDRAAYSRATG